MKRFTSDFIELLESIYRLREHLIWLPLSADDTEESLFAEICSFIEEYKHNIHNPRPVGDETDISLASS